MFAGLPLNALRTFEAAARLRSFKRAAEELHVTPTAVSHQIRALERHLGLPLFERRAGGVALAAEGTRLFHAVHGALLNVSQAIDALKPRPSSGAVTVTTTHSFAALWLVPRLGRFYQQYPDYEVRIDTTARVVDLLEDANVDIAIRYGTRDYPELVTGAILDEAFGVYGARSLVGGGIPEKPTLISVHWRDSTLYEQGWRRWCDAAGLPWMRGRPSIRRYQEEHYALQAAIAGQGLVLASSVMASDAVAQGLLFPFLPHVTVPGARYAALCAPGRERHPPARALLDWLKREFTASAGQPRKQSTGRRPR
ncbi:LysR substrate-binding domain-containing protein [Pigmentiphaga sp.]|uniref:LysR substrate-binding domain-containing protein n=1 Tax=Pigmentiphaga sp. TaxID=1977564 RepID=UPI0025F8C74B|nr:LysR substrate-binding domain-containing protein [Pigmentiphaga sp.]MBX6319011.1 LysR family transcriptional regulator [Pigmentiphaga sp.]